MRNYRIKRMVTICTLAASVLLTACSGGGATVSSAVQSEANGSKASLTLTSSVATSSAVQKIEEKEAEGSQTTASTGAKTKDKKSTDETVTLRIWDYTDNEALAQAVADYKKIKPNVTIQIEQNGKPSAEDLKTAIDQNTAPDIVNMDQVYNASLGIEGYLVDLNRYGAKKISSKFIKSAVESLSYKDKIYGLPFDANTICFYYNKNMFQQSGAQVPRDYNGLIEAGKKIKSKYGADAIAYTLPVFSAENPNWSAFNYFFYLWRMGGEILTDDLKSAAFNRPEGVEALNKMLELSKEGLLPLEYKETDFLNGQVAMLDNGSWQVDALFGSDKKAEFGATLLPELKKGIKRYSGLGLTGMAIPKSSKNKQAAYDFVRFYCTGKTYQTMYCQANNLIPSLKAAQKDSYYSGEVWKTLFKQLELSKYRPGVKNWTKIEQIIAEAVSVAMNGNLSPKEALDSAAKSVNQLLE